VKYASSEREGTFTHIRGLTQLFSMVFSACPGGEEVPDCPRENPKLNSDEVIASPLTIP